LSVVYEKYLLLKYKVCRHFRGGGGLCAWGRFIWGGKFSRLSFPGVILHWGDMTEYLSDILFICSTSLYQFHLNVEMSRKNTLKAIFRLFYFREKISPEGRISRVIGKAFREQNHFSNESILRIIFQAESSAK